MASPGEVAGELQGIAERLADMRPIMEVLAADVRTLMDDSFNQLRSPTGEPWRHLSEATESINPRRRGGRPENDTGRLRGSMTAQADQHGVLFGSNTLYAAAQNFGNPNNRLFGGKLAPVPARPFLPVNANGVTLEPADWWDEKIRMVEHWIVTGEVTG